ncbi:MAG: MarR family transcriptional regulator [Gemmatimonadaceae bacterium]
MSATSRSGRSARAAAPRPLDQSIVVSIDAFRRILRALRLAERGVQAAVGLSAAQLFVLRALEDGNEASLSDLADRTMTDRSSVAAVVERLLEAGLVLRSVSHADGRRAAIVVTGKGRSALMRSPEPPTALLVAAMSALTVRNRASLADQLVALTSAMGLDGQPAGMLFDDARHAARASRRARS